MSDDLSYIVIHYPLSKTITVHYSLFAVQKKDQNTKLKITSCLELSETFFRSQKAFLSSENGTETCAHQNLKFLRFSEAGSLDLAGSDEDFGPKSG